jgi:tRNA A-37 threonylcarbamoyl transferase component Bud32/Tfp pilus assembly protein PilZ
VETPDLAFAKAEAYKDMGLLNEAIGEFEKTLQDDALKFRAYREMASCLLMLEKPERAKKLLLKALLQPAIPKKDRLQTYLDLAGVYVHTEQPESALERLFQIKNEDSEFFEDIDERIEQVRVKFASVLDDVQDESSENHDDTTGRREAEFTSTGTLALDATQSSYSRRRAPRFRASFPLQYSFDQVQWFDGYSADISSTGLFVLTKEPIPVGSVVFLNLSLPGEGRNNGVHVIAQAAREQRSNQDKERVMGMGVYFISMEEDARSTIDGYVNELAKKAQEQDRKNARIRFACDHCGKVLSSPLLHAGKVGKCTCGKPVAVPWAEPKPSPDNPLRGSVVAGCRIDSIIGRGSAATVYKGHHLALDLPVAVKILKTSQKEAHSQMAIRFFKEAQVIAKMNHPNIVQVMNAGNDHDNTFIVMQYVPGRNLAQVLMGKEEISLDDFLRISLDVTKALGVAHEHSVVHGDVKPANILLTPAGRAMLVDFGLVKDLKDVKADVDHGLTLGTPLYISPEQVTGEQGIDVRSDIYSLGATMYHMLAKDPPFIGFTPVEVMRKHLRTRPKPLSDILPFIPEEIDGLVLKAMEKDPADRYQGAEELKQALLKMSSRMAANKFKPLAKGLKRMVGPGND